MQSGLEEALALVSACVFLAYLLEIVDHPRNFFLCKCMKKGDLLFREKQSLQFTWQSLKDTGIRNLSRLGGGRAQEQIFLLSRDIFF